MKLKIGLFSAAHMHAHGYAQAAKRRDDVELSGIWDDDIDRGRAFAESYGAPFVESPDALWETCDAAIITSENSKHLGHLETAAAIGKPALCEKPIVPTVADAERLKTLLESGAKVMTAFPCRYSASFLRLVERVKSGEIGSIQAICATNRGRCPFGWFVQPSLSGGGAMIDHVVHVADLLFVLLGAEPTKVYAQKGNRMYGEGWDDTAQLTLEYPNGLFATLDSSWSRPATYKTWGDVTMNVVGQLGVIELDMFGQVFDTYRVEPASRSVSGFGSDLDAGLVDDFIQFARGEKDAAISGWDGLRASRVALAGYASAAFGQPAAVG